MKNVKNDINSFKDWAVWLPVATALIYFYAWVFEYVTCDKLEVPASFIEPTVGSILFFAGVLVFFVTAGGLFFGGVYILVKDAKWKSGVFSLVGIIALINGAFLIHNWDWSKEDGIRMSLLGFYIWLGLLVYWGFVKLFLSNESWKRIFNWTFTDGENQLKAFPEFVRRNGIVACAIVLLILTWLTALIYVGINPPDVRILGKEPLVIVKKYGDVMICRYLDSANGVYHLNERIKLIKLENGPGIVTVTMKPAPSF